MTIIIVLLLSLIWLLYGYSSLTFTDSDISGIPSIWKYSKTSP